MSDWLDDYQIFGVGLNEGEKSLMRFAMSKERSHIIKLLSNECECDGTPDGWNYCLSHKAIDIINGENK